MPNPTGYSRIQIALHWLIALLILTQFFSGEIIHEFSHALRDGTAGLTPLGVRAHVIAGIAILVLALWRIAVRLKRGAPAASEGGNKKQELLAKIVHLALYGVMILAPLSGLAAWFGGIGIAGFVHELMKPLLIISLALHVIGTLYHQYYLKDGLLKRMMKSG